MKKEISEIIGRTISGIVVKEGDSFARSQVFLLFSDDTYYELYSDGSLRGSSGVRPGGARDVKNYMSDSQKIVYEAYSAGKS